MSIFSSKLSNSSGAYQTDIVLFDIALICKNLSAAATFKSLMVFGIIAMQSSNLFDSMFHSLIASDDPLKRYSLFYSSNVRLVIADVSALVILIVEKSSKS